MKKIFFALIAVIAALAPSTMSAYDFEVDGIYYEIIWHPEGDLVLVTNNGGYEGSYYGDVVIPETVTYNGTTYTVTMIGGYAFSYSYGLTSVTLPNSIDYIGGFAFSDCDNLLYVNLPNTIEEIPMHCFAASHNLVSVNIPSSVTKIGDYAFGDCPNLYAIEIPDNVTEIGIGAFMACTSAQYATIGKSLKTIGEGAFDNCQYLSSIIISSENPFFDSRDDCNAIIETASNTLIKGCIMTVVPNSVTTIANDAFEELTYLKTIDIPNSVTSIGYGAFAYSGLESISIGNSVISIASTAFSGCKYLSSITVDSANPVYDSRDNCHSLIETASNTLIRGGGSRIPNSVTSIGESAYASRVGMTTIDIPNSVTTISNSAFAYCSNLKSVIIPNSVVSIGKWAFNRCTKLAKAIIGDSVTFIGENAFFECDALTRISIPASVTYVGGGAFQYCDRLRSVICHANTPPGDNNVGSNSYATLFVPAESLETYQNHEEWGKFSRIVPFIGAGPGDINGDGSVAINDVTNLIDQLLSGEDLPAYADVNGDGDVTIADVTIIIDLLLDNI